MTPTSDGQSVIWSFGNKSWVYWLRHYRSSWTHAPLGEAQMRWRLDIESQPACATKRPHQSHCLSLSSSVLEWGNERVIIPWRAASRRCSCLQVTCDTSGFLPPPTPPFLSPPPSAYNPFKFPSPEASSVPPINMARIGFFSIILPEQEQIPMCAEGILSSSWNDPETRWKVSCSAHLTNDTFYLLSAFWANIYLSPVMMISDDAQTPLKICWTMIPSCCKRIHCYNNNNNTSPSGNMALTKKVEI